jgi:hypothetical protein
VPDFNAESFEGPLRPAVVSVPGQSGTAQRAYEDRNICLGFVSGDSQLYANCGAMELFILRGEEKVGSGGRGSTWTFADPEQTKIEKVAIMETAAIVLGERAQFAATINDALDAFETRLASGVVRWEFAVGGSSRGDRRDTFEGIIANGGKWRAPSSRTTSDS